MAFCDFDRVYHCVVASTALLLRFLLFFFIARKPDSLWCGDVVCDRLESKNGSPRLVSFKELDATSRSYVVRTRILLRLINNRDSAAILFNLVYLAFVSSKKQLVQPLPLDHRNREFSENRVNYGAYKSLVDSELCRTLWVYK